ncbi:hypothetical protein FAVG1_13170 [Fusarium avenaceum]|nr:hypothetical protein FAVG1_13170 [Fusarium avenaceum]
MPVEQPVAADDGEKTPAAIEIETTTVSTAEDRALVRRIDIWLCPMVALSMTLQYMDKQTLPAASILGLIQDLHLSGNQYSWVTSIFYFGYLTSTYATPYLMVRWPVGRVLCCTFLTWAAIVGGHAALKDFGGLMAARYLLGAAEAAAIPGTSLMIGMFYQRQEHALRHGFWFLGQSLGIMLAGLLSFGVANIKSGVGAWKWLFVAMGVITLIWSALMFWQLPDHPGTAKFLSKDQQVRAVARLRSNQMVVKTNRFQWDQFREALLDLRIWLLCFYLLCMSVCSSSINAFSQIVLVGLGFDVYQANLFLIAVGAVHATFSIVSTYVCSRYRNIRCITSVLLCSLSLMGSILVRFGPNLGAKMFGFLIIFAFPATISIAYSMIASNVAGFTKKSVAASIATLGYCVGNIIGPFLFFPREAPKYPSGFTGSAACFGIGIVLMVVLFFITRYENNRRDKLYGVVDQAILSVVEEEVCNTDRTDGKNSAFRYMM